MELLRQLFHGKGYIDGITVINLEGEILFSVKLNDKLYSQDTSRSLVGEKFLEVFKNLTPENSSTMKAMELGMPMYLENQLLETRGRDAIYITSLSLPIKSCGRIVGAIDLSMQETGEGGEKPADASAGDDLELAAFPVGGEAGLKKSTSASFCLDDIIAVNENMRRVKEYIPVVASCDLPVLIYGETGTGKEVVAQAIHNAGPRRHKPFIAQNCAALPDTLLESILFGTSRGAFTGAVENKGLFELADGGTLFLDEINSMPIHLQSKLLRVLQDGQIRSLGSRESRSVNVKIIAAMNTEPLKAIENGELRQDIYYRLSMMSITVPPLRERRQDIPYFVKMYVNKHNATFHKNVRYVSRELLKAFRDYNWPGNVRELEHAVVFGMSMVDPDSTVLSMGDLKDRFPGTGAACGAENGASEAKNSEAAAAFTRGGTSEGPFGVHRLPAGVSLREAVENYERNIIKMALDSAGGNVSQAAKDLMIPRQTLQRKVRQYRLLPGG